MKDPYPGEDVPRPVAQTSRTNIALVGALVLLALAVLYLSSRGNSEQDKLTNTSVATPHSGRDNRDKLCASSTTYELIKRELFRRAAQLRGSDQPAFDRLSAAAVVRMQNPVMEGQNPSTTAVNCSGFLALDLPPGVEVVGGRHTLSSDLDYSVTMAADGSGPVVLLKNADAIVTPLATVAAVHQAAPLLPQQTDQASIAAPGRNNPPADVPQAPATLRLSPAPAPRPAPSAALRPQPASASPSFDCSAARTRGESAVCADAGLAALDRQMAGQYARAFASASSDERAILKETAHRFYAYRDRCPSNACIGDAYQGRIREIRDIAEGRWQPPR